MSFSSPGSAQDNEGLLPHSGCQFLSNFPQARSGNEYVDHTLAWYIKGPWKHSTFSSWWYCIAGQSPRRRRAALLPPLAAPAATCQARRRPGAVVGGSDSLMDHFKQWTASVAPLGQKLSERFGTLVRRDICLHGEPTGARALWTDG